MNASAWPAFRLEPAQPQAGLHAPRALAIGWGMASATYPVNYAPASARARRLPGKRIRELPVTPDKLL